MMTPDEVMQICARRWKNRKGSKRANMSDPLLGSDCSWADMIDVNEMAVIGIITSMLSRDGWRKRETITMRRLINIALRNASEPANFYAMPLYVSQGMLEEIERTPEGAKKWPLEHDEHVLPLAIYASGSRLIADPLGYIPTIGRALIAPICLVTPEENKDLETKTHPDPARPFMRYKGIIEAYRTTDGQRVDPDTWTFQDHIDLMKTVPAYATGAERYESGEDRWQPVLSILKAKMAA